MDVGEEKGAPELLLASFTATGSDLFLWNTILAAGVLKPTSK